MGNPRNEITIKKARAGHNRDITHGNATIVYCSKKKLWALPGGTEFVGRKYAQVCAANIDKLLAGRGE